MAIEQTLVIIKPDGLIKSLTGNILTKLSETKLIIIAAKTVKVTKELAETHYQHLKAMPFFNELIEYIMGAHHTNRVLALVYQGENAIAKVRAIAGATNPEEADSVSIRGMYGRITTKGVFENVIHASSDSAESEREIKLWFQPDDIVGDIYPSEKRELTVKKKVWM